MAIKLDEMEKTSRFNTYSSLVIKRMNQFAIYPHQYEALIQLQAWYNDEEYRIGLVVIPTGGGKSGIAALAPYVLNTGRVLIITPSLQITNQLAAAFGRKPSKSFYVERNVIGVDAASKFVELARLIKRGQEIGNVVENLVIVNAQKFNTNSSVEWEKLNKRSYNLLIVDEAHHFPAATWDKIVSHFYCKTIFLTATPYRQGQPILTNQNGTICFQITPNKLMNNGVIRKTIFQEIGTDEDSGIERITLLSEEILRILHEHDQWDSTVRHQAMVLTLDISEAEVFAKQLNITAKREIAASYTAKDSKLTLQRFEKGQIFILVVCGKLLEGYDRKQISVCAIARNVAPTSKVLFTQFVGRCLRKIRPDDPIEGTILSHVSYNQKQNYENLNEVAEDDPDEEEDSD